MLSGAGRFTAVGGLLILAAGMAAMSLVRPGGNFGVDVLAASLVAASGMPFIPLLGTAIGPVLTMG